MTTASAKTNTTIAAILAVLSALAALRPTLAADAREAAERFTHVGGISLADLPSFEKLASRFGVSPVVESGDAGDYEARACYYSLNKKAVLEFFHGEVDWGFILRSPTRKDLHCPSSATLNDASMSIAGVELGMEKSAYEGLVGRPQRGSVSHTENVFQYVHTLTDTELSELLERGRRNGNSQSDPEELRHWDVAITLSASFTKGHLASFRVDRVETN